MKKPSNAGFDVLLTRYAVRLQDVDGSDVFVTSIVTHVSEEFV